MARCFCGCGRRVLFRGRVANLYGGNAADLVAHMEGAVELAQVEPDAFDRSSAEIADIRDGLRERSRTYREVVHREEKLGEVNRLDYVFLRDQAIALLAEYGRWLDEHPEELRKAALGRWAIENDLTDEAAMTRLREMDPAELEQLLALHVRSDAGQWGQVPWMNEN